MFEFYQDNYILPYYYTLSPYYHIYDEKTNNSKVMSKEIKWQLSFYTPIYEWEKISLNAAFTLKFYWQFYTSTPWIRSTDYNPELFALYKVNKDINTSLGISHESNGTGDEFERSWNRVYGKVNYHISDISFEFMLWFIPLKNNEAVETENDKIENYLGYEKISASYNIGNFDSKVSFQNIEHLNKIQIVFSESISFSKNYAFYFQYFYGYGQSLIEYNHFTQAFGIGLKFLEDDPKDKCICNAK